MCTIQMKRMEMNRSRSLDLNTIRRLLREMDRCINTQCRGSSEKFSQGEHMGAFRERKYILRFRRLNEEFLS